MARRPKHARRAPAKKGAGVVGGGSLLRVFSRLWTRPFKRVVFSLLRRLKFYGDVLRRLGGSEREPAPSRSAGGCALLSERERAAVEGAWRPGRGSDVLATGERAAQLTRHDLRTLRGTEWVNDEVVNFYLQLVVAQAARRRASAEACSPLRRLPPAVAALSSFFFAKLVDGPRGYDYAAVRRWTKALDVFSLDILLVPINSSNTHWTLAVLRPKLRTVEYFDSLAARGAASRGDARVLDSLTRWAADEAADKALRAQQPPQQLSQQQPQQQPEQQTQQQPQRAADAAQRVGLGDGWVAFRARGCPRQTDGSACGVFACAVAARVAAGEKGPAFRGVSQAAMPRLRMRIAADCLAGRAARG